MQQQSRNQVEVLYTATTLYLNEGLWFIQYQCKCSATRDVRVCSDLQGTKS